jgi:chloramphenicol 3-O-phosphotransferase
MTAITPIPAASCRKPDVILLNGPSSAGKSSIAQAGGRAGQIVFSGGVSKQIQYDEGKTLIYDKN